MSRRSRIPDSESAGSSNLVPYRKGESASDRHARRKHSNLKWQSEIRLWASAAGYLVQINNDGHHWILTKGTTRVEWWPSSAKLVFNQQWKGGIHCHDYQQLIQLIQQRVERQKAEQVFQAEPG
jgi:hypothetical protein